MKTNLHFGTTILANAPCDRCKRDTLHVKGVCRECGKTSPWSPPKALKMPIDKEDYVLKLLRTSHDSYALIARKAGVSRHQVLGMANKNRVGRAARKR